MGPVIRNVIRDVIRPVTGDEALVSRFSPAARDYFARLDAAGLRVARYDAANARLIDRLVSNGGNFWPDSGAFCAMAGYLYPGNGANLIPLKDGHDAGTLNALVTGDWNAVTGLKGDGSTKHVSSGRAMSADGQNDNSLGVYTTEAEGTAIGEALIGANTASATRALVSLSATSKRARLSDSAHSTTVPATTVGYFGGSRSNSEDSIMRYGGVNYNITATSAAPTSDVINVLKRSDGVTTTARLPFYHIGPNLNGAGELAELDAALTEWQAALASA